MINVSAPIVTTFVVYLIAMVAIGIWVYRRTHSFTDFALGGRKLNAPTAALSAQASDMSGWLLLGLPGAVYAAGIGATWIAVGLAVGTYLNWKFVAPRLRTYTERAKDAVSLSAYLEERFEDRTRMLRIVSAAVIVVFFTVYVASGLVAGGVLFEEMFGMNFELAVTISAAVIVVYTFLGGFLAVSLTDAIQGTLMFLALLAIPLVGIGLLGGFGALNDALNDQKPDLLDMGAEASFADGTWADGGSLSVIAVVSLLAWGLGYFGQPHILARFMGIRSVGDITVARRIGTSWALVTLAGASLVGLVGIAQLDEPLENQETVFIALTEQMLDPWLAGIILAAVLAAIMSTADSQLVVSSTALTEDFYRAFLNRQASNMTLVWVGRLTVTGVAVVAYVIALGGGAVLEIVSYAWAGFGAAFGPVIILSLFWPRMTGAGAMAGIVGGALTVVLWEHVDPYMGPFEGIYEIIPGVLLATVAALVFGRFVGRPPERSWVGAMQEPPEAEPVLTSP
ncbi:sodium/proline symporter PutP [Phytoactinopolyspora endophytica]|uniref:sodium/proline symporter PutP n=1 Tax=Phytoactinopolyspora endophytica TaxID=1642495 RepID=UPI00101D43ED|nr:sodium/proline symporter PutP [Phytoactinopolyspora endophytica]